jgi:hypothetical protein
VFVGHARNQAHHNLLSRSRSRLTSQQSHPFIYRAYVSIFSKQAYVSVLLLQAYVISIVLLGHAEALPGRRVKVRAQGRATVTYGELDSPPGLKPLALGRE